MIRVKVRGKHLFVEGNIGVRFRRFRLILRLKINANPSELCAQLEDLCKKTGLEAGDIKNIFDNIFEKGYFRVNIMREELTAEKETEFKYYHTEEELKKYIEEEKERAIDLMIDFVKAVDNEIEKRLNILQEFAKQGEIEIQIC